MCRTVLFHLFFRYDFELEILIADDERIPFIGIVLSLGASS